MRKISLANLAQNQVTQDEAQRVKGGIYCSCLCGCSCPPEYRIDDRITAKMEDLAYVRDNP